MSRRESSILPLSSIRVWNLAYRGWNFGIENLLLLRPKSPTEEPIMNAKLLLTSALALSIVTPAFAAEFYISRYGSDGPCQVVTERPTDPSWAIIGGNKAYATRDEAWKQIAVVCKGP